MYILASQIHNICLLLWFFASHEEALAPQLQYESVKARCSVEVSLQLF